MKACNEILVFNFLDFDYQIMLPFWQVDEELDELISRIKLHEGDTEFWKRRFLGEELTIGPGKLMGKENSELPDVLDDVDVGEDTAKEVEDDDGDEEEEEVEVTESQVGDRVKDKEVEASKPLQMIGVQLLKDSDQTTATRKSRRKLSRASMEVRKYVEMRMILFPRVIRDL